MKFRLKIFLISLAVISIVVGLSFLAALGRDEGTLGNGVIRNLLADSFFLFRFPIHTLFWNQLTKHMVFYFPGLIINIIFWAFVMERTIWFVKRILTKL